MRKEILVLEDGEYEAIVLEERDDGDAIEVKYQIDGVKEGYKAWYRFPKGVGDTQHIEKHTNMPNDYSGKLIKDFAWEFYPDDTKEQQKLVETFLFKFDYFLRESMGLYIHSKTRGSGKTMLACCLGNEIIKRRGLNVKFISVTDYIQAYRDKDADDYTNASVLILDDLGVQDDSKDWINEIVYALINRRYEKNLLTIFTSNCSIQKCAKDERIVSRVEKMGLEVKIPEVPVRTNRAALKKQRLLKSLEDMK